MASQRALQAAYNAGLKAGLKAHGMKAITNPQDYVEQAGQLESDWDDVMTQVQKLVATFKKDRIDPLASYVEQIQNNGTPQWRGISKNVPTRIPEPDKDGSTLLNFWNNYVRPFISFKNNLDFAIEQGSDPLAPKDGA